jgi:hypothetical protein
MLSLFLLTLLATFTAAQTSDGSAVFTYPPQDGLIADENTLNFSQNLVFYENQETTIEWVNVTNPNHTPLNLVLWHVFANQSTIGDEQYVGRKPSRTLFFDFVCAN